MVWCPSGSIVGPTVCALTQSQLKTAFPTILSLFRCCTGIESENLRDSGQGRCISTLSQVAQLSRVVVIQIEATPKAIRLFTLSVVIIARLMMIVKLQHRQQGLAKQLRKAVIVHVEHRARNMSRDLEQWRLSLHV